jgi:hypothetical protein
MDFDDDLLFFRFVPPGGGDNIDRKPKSGIYCIAHYNKPTYRAKAIHSLVFSPF